MQSYEDAPPPYSTIVTNGTQIKGEYAAVPNYEANPTNIQLHVPLTYPNVPTSPTTVQSRSVRVGHNPVHCFCPFCHQHIVTRVDYESGSFAWLMCLLLTVIGCVPCCVIPFCVTSCQDITHTCPHCSAVVGRRKVL